MTRPPIRIRTQLTRRLFVDNHIPRRLLARTGGKTRAVLHHQFNGVVPRAEHQIRNLVLLVLERVGSPADRPSRTRAGSQRIQFITA